MAQPCLAQSVASRGLPGWAYLILFVLLLAAIAPIRWRVHREALLEERGDGAIAEGIKKLERENAELQRVTERLRHFAEHDDLTGLWNRRVIVERLRQEVDRSRRDGTPLTVILADLDHFKQTNDTFGHLAGDLALMEVAGIFQRSVRSYDWVGRYGGEEFLLILPGSSFVNARARAEQFRKAVEAARITEGDTEIRITASFGVASGFPSDHESMLAAADAELYRAKASGRNCVMAVEIEAAKAAEERRLA